VYASHAGVCARCLRDDFYKFDFLATDHHPSFIIHHSLLTAHCVTMEAELKKRNQDGIVNESTEKRHRSGEHEVISRICVSSSDFGKLIGKGGQVITNIRVLYVLATLASHLLSVLGKMWCYCQGERYQRRAKNGVLSTLHFYVFLQFQQLQINGSFAQVTEAFDLISEVLFTSYIQSGVERPFCMRLLIDHKKAGKVIGIKVKKYCSLTFLNCNLLDNRETLFSQLK
jgi:hypothetical protein